MSAGRQSESMTEELRLGSFSQELWAKEMDASEWIVRRLINDLDVKGEGVSQEKILDELQRYLHAVVSRQNGGPRFFFKLGASLKLREWLEAEGESDRLEVMWEAEKPKYKLSPFIKNIMQRRESEIERLITDMTGHKI